MNIVRVSDCGHRRLVFWLMVQLITNMLRTDFDHTLGTQLII